MDAADLLIPLDGAVAATDSEVGGKAARLIQLTSGGFRVPRGFCLTTAAYARFVDAHRLEPVLRAELGRRPLAEMRWEEMWDAALRVRSLFLGRDLPPAVSAALARAVDLLGAGTPLAVRSSAPREDAADASFAGLHESVVGARGYAELVDAVRVVWASLWSDAALLYLAELGMDPAASRMAVVIQELVVRDRSGVAFGVDPRDRDHTRQVVEAVPGPCADLVDGAVDPDRWILDAATGATVSFHRGDRDPAGSDDALLAPADLQNLHRVLGTVEALCGWPADIEWTGRADDFSLLQARPVSSAAPGEADERRWYLGLRPGLRRLRELRERVTEDRIPALAGIGERLAAEDLTALDDAALAATIDERVAALAHWRAVYRDEFIPLAHGVRMLGTYYNDRVRPTDPFEFVGLVRGEELLALQRNRRLVELAARMRADATLTAAVETELASGEPLAAAAALSRLRGATGGGAWFVQAFDELRSEDFDLEYGGERLCDRPDALLRHLVELARTPVAAARSGATATSREELERRLFAASGPARAREAEEMLALGRLSWRLRDDDNLLLGRVESQVLRALGAAHRRLARSARTRGDGRVTESAAAALIAALRDPAAALEVVLPAASEPAAGPARGAARPRQLSGQPAAPGLATGAARHVRDVDDIGRFQRGEVLVCDAIQPNMTHLVPLACGIVERRGGMLIHGAIIARELGIPCVNGVSRSIADIPDGEVVTVDGHLGLVTIGAPELGLETALRVDG